MKWVIRIFFLIIGVFALAAGIGFFMSSEVNVHRTIDVFAMPEDIFPYLSNLETHENWSPWHDGDNHVGFVVSQTEDAVGQQSAWICETASCVPGTEEIKLVQHPEYVQTDLNLDGSAASATYGLMSGNADGSTTIFLEIKKNVGGFPYIQRLIKFREISALEDRLDRALGQLKTLIMEEGIAE